MRGLSNRTIELIVFARKLLEEFRPMTLRQLHYGVFSAAVIDYENNERDYKRLSRATTYARRLHRERVLAGYPDYLIPHETIPHEWIIDELREAEMVNVFENVQDYLNAVKRSYRRDNWQDQPNYCEVWSEKATVLGSLRPVTQEFGVMLRACRGFGSTGMEGQVGSLFEDIQKPITVFYVGDHDPSGHDIERDIHERAQRASGKDFEMLRLAIHGSDIRAFKLPPQRIKVTDSRARGFKQRFGARAATVELDALPVAELRRRVSQAVELLIDPETWERQVRIQEVEFNSISEFVEKVKSLPQVK